MKVGTERHCVHPASEFGTFFLTFYFLVIEMYPTGKHQKRRKRHIFSLEPDSKLSLHSRKRKESQNKLYRFVQRDVDSENEAREHARSSRCSAVPVSTGAVLV